MWKQIESRLIVETKPFHLGLKVGFQQHHKSAEQRCFLFKDTFEETIQSWPALISVSVDQMIFSANKRHQPLLCLLVCIAACAPTHQRHFVFLSELPFLLQEKCTESDYRHIPDALYGVNDGPVEKRRERRCREDIGWSASEVTGEAWQHSFLPGAYVEERGDTNFQLPHREKACYVY